MFFYTVLLFITMLNILYPFVPCEHTLFNISFLVYGTHPDPGVFRVYTWFFTQKTTDGTQGTECNIGDWTQFGCIQASTLSSMLSLCPSQHSGSAGLVVVAFVYLEKTLNFSIYLKDYFSGWSFLRWDFYSVGLWIAISLSISL